MTLGTGGFSASFELGRGPEPIAIPLPVGQISPDKSVCSRTALCAAAEWQHVRRLDVET